MQDLSNKITGNTLLASEWNEVPSELQNLIESTGQTLTDLELDQVGKAVAHYVGSGSFFVDNGIADVYQLVPVGNNLAPPDYHNGQEIEFIVANTNTGTSTVNVDTIGVKNINSTEEAGVLEAGTIARMRFNSSSDAFDIISTSDLTSGLFTDDYLPSADTGIVGRGFTDTGELPINFGAPGTSDGSFSVVPFFVGSGDAAHTIRGVAINQNNGDIWVVDPNASEVYRAARNTVDDFVETTDGYPGTDPRAMAFNSSTQDVLVLDSTDNQVDKLTGAVGSWAPVGNYDSLAGTLNPLGIAVNDNTGDIWVTDTGASNENVYLSAGGTANFAIFAYPGTVPRNVAVNQSTGDVWVIDSSEAAVYKLANGLTSNSFTTSGVGSYPDSNPGSIAVNSITGEIWIQDLASGTIYLSNDGSDNWVSVSVHGNNLNSLAVYDDVGKVYGGVFDDGSEDVLFAADGTNINIFIKS